MNSERKAKALKILLKNVTIIDPKALSILKEVDVLVQDGRIAEIGEKFAVTADHIQKDNPTIYGWFDSSVILKPGYEERETLENGLKTARKAGLQHRARPRNFTYSRSPKQ